MSSYEGRAPSRPFSAHGSWKTRSSTLGRALASRRLVVASILLLLALALGLQQSLPVGHSAPSARARSGLTRASLFSLPLAAQAPVSATLGAGSHAYAIQATTGAIQATTGALSAANRAQRLAFEFTSSGVSIKTGVAQLGLRLAGIGYGSALRPIAPATPRASVNRVAYEHLGVSESYTNGPLGLEQGFTIDHAPAGPATGPLTLAVALSGDTQPVLQQGGNALMLTRAGKHGLLYTGLRVGDARGRLLHAWLSLTPGRVLLHVDARGASYPLRVDPFIQRHEGFNGEPEEAGAGFFGDRVALSRDGDTAVIGAPFELNESKGAAYIFTRAGFDYTQQGPKLTGGKEGDDFGEGVAVSEDGNTVLIGSPGTTVGGQFAAGAVWVFTRSGSTWTQQGAPLTPKSGEESGEGSFGRSVAISADGTTALIGAPSDSGGAGAVWAFTHSGSSFKQQSKKITGAGATGFPSFGASVALSAEGTTALVGGPLDSAPGGALWVLTRSGSSWGQQAGPLIGIDEGEKAFSELGYDVALSANGNTALGGAPGESAAYVFTRSGATWSQQGPKLQGGTGSRFGDAVSLSGTGNTALVGAISEPFDGAAFAFTRSGETWSQFGPKLVGEELGEESFGESVALSADGEWAVVGLPEIFGGTGAFTSFVTGPEAQTGSATEVTHAGAKLTAAVNPRGQEVTSCKFEYGLTTGYGSTAACSPSPGSGESPVEVSAAISGLTANSTYHYRVKAVNAIATTESGDATFTTLATSETAETAEPTKPVEVTDEKLTAKASEGVGKITAGPYGSDIGGLPLFGGKAKYIDVYRSDTATFAKIEFKDCELGGAKTIWWDNPKGGWEPIPEPTAVYKEGAPPCISVTVTKATTPNVEDMTGTRFGFAQLVGNQEYGKCLALKKGLYGEGCGAKVEKKGKPDGTYEWYGLEAGATVCYAKKDARYKESKCKEPDEKKGKLKGKYEKGSNAVTGKTGTVKLEIEKAGTVECKGSSSQGELESAKAGKETITFNECIQESAKCTSAGAAEGSIRSEPLEITTYEGGTKKFFTGWSGQPLMRFTCSGTEYTVSGEVSGETSGDINKMSPSSETVFKAGAGFQGLQTVSSKGTSNTTFTATLTVSNSEGVEISEVDKRP